MVEEVQDEGQEVREEAQEVRGEDQNGGDDGDRNGLDDRGVHGLGGVHSDDPLAFGRDGDASVPGRYDHVLPGK